MDGITKTDAFDREYFTPGTVILLTFSAPYCGFGAGQYHAIIEECDLYNLEVALCEIVACGGKAEMHGLSVEIGDYISGRVGIEIIRRLTK